MLLSNAPVTLSQYLMMSNDPLVQVVTYSLIKDGMVLQDIPIATKPTLIANGMRFVGNLPSVNWVALNADAQNVSGTPQPYQEQAYIIREAIDIDKFMQIDQNAIADPRQVQSGAALKAIAYDFNDKFVNNDHVVGNVNSFVGLKYRINNGVTYGVNATGLIDAGGATADMSTGMTAATVNIFLELLDQALWAIDAPNGDPNVVIYMNDVLLRRIRRGLRLLGTQGGLDQTQDQFQRTIETYKGCTLRDIGYKADQATRIITTTETAAGVNGASTFTSLYAVNYNDGYFMGWQMEPLVPEDLGKVLGVTYRTLIDWAVGLVNVSTRSVSRIFDIKLA
jgi:hypothetical protein